MLLHDRMGASFDMSTLRRWHAKRKRSTEAHSSWKARTTTTSAATAADAAGAAGAGTTAAPMSAAPPAQQRQPPAHARALLPTASSLRRKRATPGAKHASKEQRGVSAWASQAATKAFPATKPADKPAPLAKTSTTKARPLRTTHGLSSVTPASSVADRVTSQRTRQARLAQAALALGADNGAPRNSATANTTGNGVGSVVATGAPVADHGDALASMLAAMSDSDDAWSVGAGGSPDPSTATHRPPVCGGASNVAMSRQGGSRTCGKRRARRPTKKRRGRQPPDGMLLSSDSEASGTDLALIGMTQLEMQRRMQQELEDAAPVAVMNVRPSADAGAMPTYFEPSARGYHGGAQRFVVDLSHDAQGDGYSSDSSLEVL